MPIINPPIRDLASILTDIRKRLHKLETARPLEKATIGRGGIRSADFDGTDFAHPGTTGNYFGADGLVINNVNLRNGIIGNDALTNPASFFVANADWDVLTFTTVNMEKTVTIPVPSGFSQALVMATATAGATASATAVANTYVSCSIQGVHPEFVANQLSVSRAGSVTRSYAASLTGLLGGGTVTIGALGVIDTNGTVVANSCNLHVTGTAIFLR